MKRVLLLGLSFFVSLDLFAAGGHREPDLAELANRLHMVRALSQFDEKVGQRVFGLAGIPNQIERHLVSQVSRIDWEKKTALGPRQALHLVTPPESLAVSRMFEILGELVDVVRVDFREVAKNSYIYGKFEIAMLGLLAQQGKGSGRNAPMVVVFENIDAISDLQDREFIERVILDIRSRGELYTTEGRVIDLIEFPLVISTSSYPRALWAMNASQMSTIEHEFIVDVHKLIKPETRFYDRNDPFFRDAAPAFDLMKGFWSWNIPKQQLVPDLVRGDSRVIHVPVPFGKFGNSMSFPAIEAQNVSTSRVEAALFAENDRDARFVYGGGAEIHDLIFQRALGSQNGKVPALHTQEIYEATEEIFRAINEAVRSELWNLGIHHRGSQVAVYEVSGEGKVIQVFGRVVPKNQQKFDKELRSREAFEAWQFFDIKFEYNVETGALTKISSENFAAKEGYRPYMRGDSRIPELHVGGPFRSHSSLYHKKRVLIAGFEAAFNDLISQVYLRTALFRGADAGDYQGLERLLESLAEKALGSSLYKEMSGKNSQEVSSLFDFGFKVGKQIIDLAARANFSGDSPKLISNIYFGAGDQVFLEITSLSIPEVRSAINVDAAVTDALNARKIPSRRVRLIWNPSTQQFAYNLPALLGGSVPLCSRFL